MDTNNIFKCKDIHGNIVEIDMKSLGNFTLFGMDTETILALRVEYLKRGGPILITADSVKHTFNVTK